MIKINKLDKYFNKGKLNEIHVINDVSLEFPDTGLVVLLGASGSGKTTLLNAIGGLDKVNSGNITINEEKITKYKASVWDKIRQEDIGYIFQNYNLIPDLSVYDNIAFVLRLLKISDKEVVKKYVDYVLKAVNMYSFRKKNALQLSGGQQQRVAIARALVKNPSIIIADEPTGNLDSKNTIDIMNIIKEISKQKLVILVTHERELANFYGDRIIEIVDGKVINDHINVSSRSGNFGNDDTIYLDDLNLYNSVKDADFSFDYYSDTAKDPMNVKLIVKNNTIYLDISGKNNKVKLVDDSVLKIAHGSKKQKTDEEISKTDFDSNFIDVGNSFRGHKTQFSIKTAFKQALSRILSTRKRSLLMYIMFLLCGSILAMSSALIWGNIDSDVTGLMPLSSDYVFYTSSKELSLDDVNSKIGDKGFVNPFGVIEVVIDRVANYSNPTIGGGIDLHQNLKPSDLISGRMPLNDYEFVTSRSNLISYFENSIFSYSANLKEFGIWSYEELYYETFTIKGIDSSIKFKLVGITKDERKGYFVSQNIAELLVSSEVKASNSFISYEITHGCLPKEMTDIIMEESSFIKKYGDIGGNTFPYSTSNGEQITGVFNNLSPVLVNDILHSDAFIDLLILDSYNDINYRNNEIIYSVLVKDKTLISELNNDLNTVSIFTMKERYQKEIANTKNSFINSSVIYAVALVFITISGLGFYFIIRSSMLSRIYNISIHRALAVRKIDIIKGYTVEICLITGITTLIGFVIGMIGLGIVSGSLLGGLQLFNVGFLSIFTGILACFLINLVFGLLPLIMLLKKTPSEILSRYDI